MPDFTSFWFHITVIPSTNFVSTQKRQKLWTHQTLAISLKSIKIFKKIQSFKTSPPDVSALIFWWEQFCQQKNNSCVALYCRYLAIKWKTLTLTLTLHNQVRFLDYKWNYQHIQSPKITILQFYTIVRFYTIYIFTLLKTFRVYNSKLASESLHLGTFSYI